jgi:hypothetical protein
MILLMSVKFFIFLSKYYVMKMSGLCSEKDNLNVNVQDQMISQIIFSELALGTLIFLCKFCVFFCVSATS